MHPISYHDLSQKWFLANCFNNNAYLKGIPECCTPHNRRCFPHRSRYPSSPIYTSESVPPTTCVAAPAAIGRYLINQSIILNIQSPGVQAPDQSNHIDHRVHAWRTTVGQSYSYMLYISRVPETVCHLRLMSRWSVWYSEWLFFSARVLFFYSLAP